MSLSTSPTSASTDLNDPSLTLTILNENPKGDAYAPKKRMSPKHCRSYSRTKRDCAACGKEFHINRLRCRNPYLCDNCGSGALWAWRWHQERDMESLEKMEQTGVELMLPSHGLGLREREERLLALYDKFIERIGCAQVRMPIIDPRSSNAGLRAALAGRHRLDHLSRLWKAVTNGKGWLSIRPYRPGEGGLSKFSEWVFSGLEPLRQLSDEERQRVEWEFGSSQRVSATRSSVYYSPLSKAEQQRRRLEFQSRHDHHLCSCCGSKMRDIPFEEQEVMTLDEMQAKYPDCRIIIEDEYDPFEESCEQKKVSIGHNRKIAGLDLRMWPSKDESPPN